MSDLLTLSATDKTNRAPDDPYTKLLLLAAAAIGLKAQYSNNFGGLSIGDPYSEGEYRWNPDEDDRLCANLEAALQINITWLPYRIVQAKAGVHFAQESYGSDRKKARRLASVKVAAEIGGALQ